MAYTIEGTNETYDGKVVRVGNHYYTTQDGSLSGFSQKLVETPDGGTINQSLQSQVSSNEDVVTTFVTGDGSRFGKRNRRYYYADGRLVPKNVNLHHHTIRPEGRSSNFMTQHTMDGNEQDIFTSKPSTRRRTTVSRQSNQTTQTTTTTATTTSTTAPAPTSTGGGTTGGGTTGGGTGGGGGGY